MQRKQQSGLVSGNKACGECFPDDKVVRLANRAFDKLWQSKPPEEQSRALNVTIPIYTIAIKGRKGRKERKGKKEEMEEMDKKDEMDEDGKRGKKDKKRSEPTKRTKRQPN